MVNVIVDIILGIILLIGFIWGLKSGFVKAVAKPAKFLLAIMLSIMLSSVVGGAIVKPMIQDPIVTKLSDSLSDKIGEGIDNTDDLPTIVRLAADLADVDLESISDAEAQEDMVDAILVAVTDPILNLVSTIIAFVLLYLLLKILIGLLFGFINGIVDNGPVGAVNRALGCAVMTMFTFLIAWLLCMASDFILNIPIINDQAWVQEFTGGWLYNLFRSMSPIDLILSLLLSF